MMEISELYVYTDGGARGNPGPAAIGIVLFDKNGNKIAEHKESIGRGTNNQAEYRALIKALELSAEHCRKTIVCFLDSKLVVNQLNGIWKTKNKKLRELCDTVKDKERVFEKVAYNHVGRSNEFITYADRLVNNALDGN